MNKQILEIFRNIIKDFPEINNISLEVVENPNSELIKEIQEIIQNRILNIVIDSSLISGYRIVAGDKVFDASLKQGLDDLNKQLKISLDDDSVDPVTQVFDALHQYNFKPEIVEEGTISEVRDGIVIINGLENCLNQELLLTDSGVNLNVFNLESGRVGAMVLGDYSKINVGDTVKRTKRVLSIGVSDSVLGRIVDPLMNPLDGKGHIAEHQYLMVDSQAPGVIERSPVDTPLQTGIKVLDALVPIGKGQRELIIGDRQTGKTTLALDTIINQKGKNVICIYVSIGQKESKLARIVEKLKNEGCMDYCIFVDAPGAAPASMQYLAPYSATAIAEFFAKKGRDVLVVYDDLSKHAVAYREISLILNRPPGREAYPGDIFYLHSRLLERSCKLAPEFGGGTITSLPIIETLAGDISAYIPTNVISITDGQIFLESELFNKGIRPAINPGLSVSRVGGAAQTKAMKKVAGSMKLALAQFRELEAFSQFSSELDESTKKSLNRGKRIQELLKQKNDKPVDLVDQVLTFYGVNNGAFDNTEIENIQNQLQRYLTFMKVRLGTLDDELNNGAWPEGIEDALKESLDLYILNN